MTSRSEKLARHAAIRVLEILGLRVSAVGLRLGIAAYAVGLSILPGSLMAVEWSSPPGINVAAQEKSLKDQVTRAAASYVGDELVDVIVHIGYVRMERSERQGDSTRIKLPGFESYITAGEAQEEIVSAFARLRQVFVMVSPRAQVRPEGLARQLSSAVGMAPDQGDSLRVIVTAGSRPAQLEPAGREEPRQE